MIFVDLLIWWYGPGWLQMFRLIQTRTQKVGSAFSIPTLLKTLFSPWRRIMSPGGKGLDAQMRALLDNAVSRTVGFVVRIMVLVAAGFGTVGSFIYGVVVALVWPLIPVLIVYCLLRGLTG
jgi:hypothetical protein